MEDPLTTYMHRCSMDLTKTFKNFQTVVKYFLKYYGAQIPFSFVTGNLSP